MAEVERKEERICGGSRERPSEKSGEGKTVSALTRMFVIVSSRCRCGLNWYLFVPQSGSRLALPCVLGNPAMTVFVPSRRGRGAVFYVR